jgi:hypothetical protein
MPTSLMRSITSAVPDIRAIQLFKLQKQFDIGARVKEFTSDDPGQNSLRRAGPATA